MKKFVLNISLFLFISLVFLTVFNYAYANTVLERKVLSRSEEQFYSHKDGIKYLFLGDSHVMKGINPEIIPNSFNFATPGESYVMTYYKLKYILDNDLVKPELITLPIDFHSFTTLRLYKISNEWFWDKYVEFEDIVDIVGITGFVEHTAYSQFPILSEGKDFLKFHIDEPEESLINMGMDVSYKDFSKKDNKIKKAEIDTID